MRCSFTGKSKIAEDILAYLADHPDAQDTLEGVSQFWLLEGESDRVEIVKQALAELVAKGFILEHQGEDGRIRYRAKARKKKLQP